MLIDTNKGYKPRDVLAIKFGTGEEILATLVSTDGTNMTVTKPVIMQLVLVMVKVQFNLPHSCLVLMTIKNTPLL
jgi:hypothetical protein